MNDLETNSSENWWREFLLTAPETDESKSSIIPGSKGRGCVLLSGLPLPYPSRRKSVLCCHSKPRHSHARDLERPKQLEQTQSDKGHGPSVHKVEPCTEQGHTIAETWGACLRAVLPLATSEDRRLPVERKGKRLSLEGGEVAGKAFSVKLTCPCRHTSNVGSQRGSGISLAPALRGQRFSLSSHFKSGSDQRLGICSTFSWGGLLLFSALLSVLWSSRSLIGKGKEKGIGRRWKYRNR